MKLDVLYFLVIGYFVEVSDAGHSKHVKIVVPQYFHKHNHKHVVYKKVPVHEHEKKHFVIHKHDHKHKHKHDHGHKHGHDHKHKHKHGHGHKHKGHHDHKHKHGHKHKHQHHHHKKHGHHGHHDHHGHHGWYRTAAEPYRNLPQQNDDDFNLDPVGFDDDGYHTSKKSVRSEHFEVETVNPHAEWPEEKHKVRGSYKVEETDPFDFTTTSYHTYDSPVTKEIAQALTNFGGKYDHLYPYKTTSGESEEPEQQQGYKEPEQYQGYKDPEQYQGYKVTEKTDESEAEGEGQSEGQSEAQGEDEGGEAGYDHEGVAEYEDENPFGEYYKNYEDYGDTKEQVQQYQVDPYTGQVKAGGDREGYDYGDETIERYVHSKVYGGYSGDPRVLG